MLREGVVCVCWVVVVFFLCVLGGSASKRLEELSHEHASRLEAHLVERFNQAEEEIASYERARRTVVDEHMAALVVETTRIVLHKELT